MRHRPLLPATTGPALRQASLLALLAFLPTACASWRTVPVTEVVRGDERVDDVELRFRLPGDPRRWHLQVEQVALPFVVGMAWPEQAPAPGGPSDPSATEVAMTAPARPSPRRVDLSQLEEVEIYSPGRGVAMTGLITVAVLIALFFLSPPRFEWGSQQPAPWSPGPRR
jgi:hypothetical protein